MLPMLAKVCNIYIPIYLSVPWYGCQLVGLFMCAQIMHVVAPRGCVDNVRLRESALKANSGKRVIRKPRGCVDSVRLRESALKTDSGKRVISCCPGKSNFEQQQQQALKLGGIPDSSADRASDQSSAPGAIPKFPGRD